MNIASCFLVLSAIFSLTCGLKVLGVLPFFGSSHFAVGHGIIKALHESGHEVTVFSPFPRKTPVPNYHDIVLTPPDNMNPAKGQMNAFDFAKGGHPAMLIFILYKMMGNDLVHSILNDDNYKKMIKSKEKFDVCVLEIFNIDAVLGIAEHFDCVLISYTTFGVVKWPNDMTGNQMPPSYVAHPFLKYTDKMNFVERLENTVVTLVEHAAFEVHKWNQRRLYNTYFPNAKRSFDEMYKSSAIIFLNQHVSYESARPLMPNMIEIGGIHVEPARRLDKQFQDFIDSAENGVVLFSMGSLLKATNLPLKTREAFTRAFGRLKQKVIWKYENDSLPNKPDNVMISKWIPQRDIVAHPNVKVFMTHGGLLGTTEALVEGKPVLGFPVFGDQKMNIAKTVEKGYGLKIDLDEVTEESVYEKLTELLSNSKYDEMAKIISSRFNDRPMTPKELVVYWTEHAVRHKGAPHLQAQAANMSFIEFHLLDVYLVLAIFAFVILYIEYLIMKFIFKKVFCNSSEKVKTS